MFCPFLNLEFLEKFTNTFGANLPSIYYPTLNVTFPNVSLLKSIYFNCFYELLMFLSIESQEEPNFPMAKSQIARGTQPTLFPTLRGAHSGCLQGSGTEGVRGRNRALL